METNFRFLPVEITDFIKQRKTLDEETLLLLYRELEAMSRLLSMEIFFSEERKSLRRLALHQRVNYLQTPTIIHGLLPSVELSLELSGYSREIGYLKDLQKPRTTKVEINQTEIDLILSELEV